MVFAYPKHSISFVILSIIEISSSSNESHISNNAFFESKLVYCLEVSLLFETIYYSYAGSIPSLLNCFLPYKESKAFLYLRIFKVEPKSEK